MKNVGVSTVFHYVPLHSSSHGKIVARSHGDMLNTDELSNRLVRLPLWIGLEPLQDQVICAIGNEPAG